MALFKNCYILHLGKVGMPTTVAMWLSLHLEITDTEISSIQAKVILLAGIPFCEIFIPVKLFFLFKLQETENFCDKIYKKKNKMSF